MKTEHAPEVVIVTASRDRDAFMVRWALAQKGARACFFFPVATLCGENISVEIGSSAFDLRVGTTYGFEGLPDALWLRRLPPQLALPPQLDPREEPIVSAQAYYLHRGILAALSSTCFSVNPLAGRHLADLKIEQLRLARAVGFVIPETLISNDPEDVRAFARRHGRIVCKGLGFARWESEGRMRVHATARLTAKELEGREASIQACPAIYQTELIKAAEARVTVMGRTLFCTIIRSQEHPDGQVDWRVVQNLAPLLDEGNVPERIREHIFEIMSELGIVFAAFDFVIDHQGNWSFLEVNEAGQFLWLEHAQPQQPMLDAFCEFLMSQDSEFEYRPTSSALRLADYRADADAVAAEVNVSIMSLSAADVAGKY